MVYKIGVPHIFFENFSRKRMYRSFISNKVAAEIILKMTRKHVWRGLVFNKVQKIHEKAHLLESQF